MLRILSALLTFFVVAPLAHAFEIDAMSDTERAIFRAEIRNYLLENPEVLMEAIAVLENRRDQQASAQEMAMLENNRDEIFDDGFSFVGGNPDGDVTMVEFLDYRCGYCKRAHPAVKTLLKDDGNIRLIVKEYPILGEQSTLSSSYAIAAKLVEGDAAYEAIHERLMTHNGQVNKGYLARLSRDLDLDHKRISKAMEGDEVSDIIARNRALAARLQIQGTPSFIMGETFVRGFVELDQMRAIVASIRQERG